MNSQNKLSNNEYSIGLGKKELTGGLCKKLLLNLCKLYLPAAIGFKFNCCWHF